MLLAGNFVFVQARNRNETKTRTIIRTTYTAVRKVFFMESGFDR